MAYRFNFGNAALQGGQFYQNRQQLSEQARQFDTRTELDTIRKEDFGNAFNLQQGDPFQQVTQPNDIPGVLGMAQPRPTAPAMNPNLSPEANRLLATIRGTESDSNYNVMYGGSTFDDYSKHPNTPHRIKSGPNQGQFSSAAGAYQFLGSTWNEQQKKYGYPDFSKQSQDKAAWFYARDQYKSKTGRDLQDDLASGDPALLKGVGHALKSTWTSLPGGIEQASRYGGGKGDAFSRGLQAPIGPGVQFPTSTAASDATSVPQSRYPQNTKLGLNVPGYEQPTSGYEQPTQGGMATPSAPIIQGGGMADKQRYAVPPARFTPSKDYSSGAAGVLGGLLGGGQRLKSQVELGDQRAQEHQWRIEDRQRLREERLFPAQIYKMLNQESPDYQHVLDQIMNSEHAAAVFSSPQVGTYGIAKIDKDMQKLKDDLSHATNDPSFWDNIDVLGDSSKPLNERMADVYKKLRGVHGEGIARKLTELMALKQIFQGNIPATKEDLFESLRTISPYPVQEEIQ